MADVQTPEMGLKLTLLLYGSEMIYGNSSWRKNINFLRKCMYRSKNNNMVIMYKFPLPFDLMAVTNETMAPGVGNLVQKEIINIPEFCLQNQVCKLTITAMVMMCNSEIIYNYFSTHRIPHLSITCQK
jgi:hypothetical protein